MPMAATKVWTLADLDALPEDGNRYELVHGVLLVTPAPGTGHEMIANRLHELLAPYVARHALGHIYRPRAVIQTGESQVEPDLQVRHDPRMGQSWTDAPVPILTIEVLSPSNRPADVVLRRQHYGEVGVAEFWIADPARCSISVSQLGRTPAEFTDALTWHPTGASDPLRIDVQSLFR